MTTTDDMPGLMAPDEVARYLGVSVHTLKSWRKTGSGPAYTKLGAAQNARVRYTRAAVLSYAEQYSRTPAVS